MLFSSASFLYAFLPLTLLAYYIAPKRYRNAVLLIASLFFYFVGEPVYVLLLVFSSLSDWLHSLYIEAHRDTPAAKRALVSSIVINLAMLAVFKYTDFIITMLNSAFSLNLPLTHIPLPLGISFFTFQTMSYTIDVYRGRVRAQRNLATFATFVCLFPQLVAGPIVRYSDVERELMERETAPEAVAEGVRRFAVGLGKKVLIANTMGELCSKFTQTNEMSVLFCWLYAIGFMLQIYFDFSGYSDMAIGLGRMFGFSFPENFDHPYLSRSVTEFWRRWHMTLGGWFRDYVYIPLGGNRVKAWKWLRNIAVVWLLTGLWHGADWNFVLWGAFFGVLLAIEKLWLLNALERTPSVLRRIYVLFAVLVSFVLFNASGVKDALYTISGLFGGGGLPAVSAESLYALKSYAVMLAVAAVGATELPLRLWRRVRERPIMAAIEPIGIAAIIIVSTAFLVDGSFNPFLYFRF